MRGNVAPATGLGFYPDDAADNQVTGNVAEGNATGGFAMERTERHIVRDNTAEGNGGDGFRVEDLTGTVGC